VQNSGVKVEKKQNFKMEEDPEIIDEFVEEHHEQLAEESSFRELIDDIGRSTDNR
jgi:hypothetical protein